MKRLFDILAAGAGLIFLSPVLLATALAILALDGRPVLFFHERVGRGGRTFKMLKFRSMVVRSSGGESGFDAGDRQRVTAVGRFLRRSKLDELPQLWNVLTGDMSLVGPRPEVRAWTRVYPQRWRLVHTVRPGITDPAAIVFRNEEEVLAAAADPEKSYRLDVLPRKLDMYEAYVRGRTFSGDLRIIWQTLCAVLRGIR